MPLRRSGPITFSSIPFPLKALKLILVETKTSKASDDYNTSWDLDDDDEDDDDDGGDDGDWADDGPSLMKNKPVDEFGFLSGSSLPSSFPFVLRPSVIFPW